jgi:hypothetical protein
MTNTVHGQEISDLSSMRTKLNGFVASSAEPVVVQAPLDVMELVVVT